MEIELEEIENKDGFITVFDDDGLISIQMTQESVVKIIDKFNTSIINKEDNKSSVDVMDNNENITLLFNLLNDEGGDIFHLTCIHKDSGNFYHEFALEECDLKTWNKIIRISKYNE